METKEKRKRTPRDRASRITTGLVIGVGIGAALGNFGVGIAIGVALGASLEWLACRKLDENSSSN